MSMRFLGPFVFFAEVERGYAGTWLRKTTLSLRLRSHSVSWSISVQRFREKGR